MATTDQQDPVEQLDPFEAFDRAMGSGIVTNPYPDFAELRSRPLVPTDIRSLMGVDASTAEAPGAAAPEGAPALFTVTTFDAAQEVLRDGKRFSSSGYSEIMGKAMGRTILEMDEPDHHAYRSLIQQAFTRKAMESWEGDLVVPVVDELIDRFVGQGRAELVRQLFFPFPVNVIAGLLGLPRQDLTQFHRWAVELISVTVDLQQALRASQSLSDYLRPFIHERRSSPGPDLVSVLAQAEHDGQRLSDDEIVSFCRLLLPAGAETTYRSSSNLFLGLLTHPDQLDAVRRDRSLVPQAMEEGLRWEPPLLISVRTVTEDTEVDGVPLPAGTTLVVNLGSANHDESRWEDPDSFDITRPLRPHAAFATGPHLCLGMHLARMETSVVTNRLLDRLPDLRVDPHADPPAITGMTFRAPRALPVVFDSIKE